MANQQWERTKDVSVLVYRWKDYEVGWTSQRIATETSMFGIAKCDGVVIKEGGDLNELLEYCEELDGAPYSRHVSTPESRGEIPYST